jgi:hypothetical protein
VRREHRRRLAFLDATDVAMHDFWSFTKCKSRLGSYARRSQSPHRCPTSSICSSERYTAIIFSLASESRQESIRRRFVFFYSASRGRRHKYRLPIPARKRQMPLFCCRRSGNCGGSERRALRAGAWQVGLELSVTLSPSTLRRSRVLSQRRPSPMPHLLRQRGFRGDPRCNANT